MSDKERNLLDPLQKLLLVAGDERFVPSELAGRINTLNALLVDLGKRMNEEMRAKWKDRIGGAVSDCDRNSYDLVADKQKVCIAALRTLRGRFYEVVENDYSIAAAHYEEAANAMDFLPNELRWQVVGKMLSMKQYQNIADTNSAFYLKLLPVYLWDWAGDSYCRVNNKMEDARRCYEQGLGILRPMEAEGSEVEQWQICLCHLEISLANLLLAHFDEWGKAQALYEDAADVVFFKREKKENEQYRGICSIIVSTSSEADVFDFAKSDWTPHVKIPAAQKYREGLTKLKAELGQRALDLLRKEFEKSEEEFPVPETYYLVAFLGELYLALKEYEKCADIVGKGESFDDGFFEWTIDELKQHADWAFPFVVHTGNEYFAKGLLQRPDYKEFLEHQKKVEESHQRQEWKQMRVERHLEAIQREVAGAVTVDKIQNKLIAEKPWLENATNSGSVVNAEVLYEQLGKQNWGEVVMGYCNAVEEELKQFLYKEYLAYYAEKYNEGYEEESRRQREKGSVLYFIANVTTNTMKNQIWNQFVDARFPEQKEFLLNQLPQVLAELSNPRNPSAHGKMPERKKAERTREIVLGMSGKPALLERLVALHQSHGGKKAT
jgi:hypothetical protein